MAVVPTTSFYDFAREMENFRKSVFFDDFGFGQFPEDFFQMGRMLPISIFHPEFLRYPFQQLNQLYGLGTLDEKERMTIDKDGFQVTFDVKEFKPNELTVKTVNNFVVVEGKHEDRKDDRNFSQKHFSRTYLLPSGYNAEELVSTISTDGVLCVKVPAPHGSIECKERTVKIKETGTN